MNAADVPQQNLRTKDFQLFNKGVEVGFEKKLKLFDFQSIFHQTASFCQTSDKTEQSFLTKFWFRSPTALQIKTNLLLMDLCGAIVSARTTFQFTFRKITQVDFFCISKLNFTHSLTHLLPIIKLVISIRPELPYENHPIMFKRTNDEYELA